jgi:hypothetical protein
MEDKIGSLSLTPFTLSHDVETVGFTLTVDGERMGFITDTGYVPDRYLEAFSSLDYLYIESNHDVEMYKSSSKPWHVIKRNLGPTGHLSNEQCGQAWQRSILAGANWLCLATLSEDDNEPGRALQNARRVLAPGISLTSAPGSKFQACGLINLLKYSIPAYNPNSYQLLFPSAYLKIVYNLLIVFVLISRFLFSISKSPVIASLTTEVFSFHYLFSKF